MSKASNQPALSAQTSYEYTGDYTSTRFRDSIRGWSVGVQSGWAIFDGHAQAGKQSQSRSRSSQTQINAENLLLGINLEARESHSASIETEQMLLAATKTVAEAADSLRGPKASEQDGMAKHHEISSIRFSRTD